jgi:hypothetical protein
MNGLAPFVVQLVVFVYTSLVSSASDFVHMRSVRLCDSLLPWQLRYLVLLKILILDRFSIDWD